MSNDGYAELWLSELGAYVPEWHDGGPQHPYGARRPLVDMRCAGPGRRAEPDPRTVRARTARE